MPDTTETPFNWHAAIGQTYDEISQKFVEHFPYILGALALLVLGWLIAHVLKLVTRKLVQGLNTLFRKASKNDGVKRERIKESYALIISNVVFWSTIVFFVAASANLLGWGMFSSWMDSIVTFLPSLITGLVIILAGFLVANVVRSGISTAATRSGMARSSMLPRVAQAVVLFTFIIIGAEQIGLNVHFLTNIVVVIVGILLAGAALAFSFGAKTMVANILGAHHTNRHCRVGERLVIANYEGEIVEVTQTAIVLETANGRAIIPAKLFNEQASHVVSDIDAHRQEDTK